MKWIYCLKRMSSNLERICENKTLNGKYIYIIHGLYVTYLFGEGLLTKARRVIVQSLAQFQNVFHSDRYNQ